MAKLNTVQLLRLKDPSLTKDSAAALVSCRNVYVDGELCTDPKQMFDKNACIEIIFPKYVSRGGFKLEKALSSFNLDVGGLVMLDAGSSTGGFTDCLLQNGAKAVHSVDVGFNLLDFKLRSDDRVITGGGCGSVFPFHQRSSKPRPGPCGRNVDGCPDKATVRGSQMAGELLRGGGGSGFDEIHTGECP